MPRSLLEFRFKDPSLPFISNSDSVRPYLYHFETSVSSMAEKMVNVTRTIAVPVVTAWVNITEILRIELSPEEFFNDTTCNYGATGDQKFNASLGKCPSGRTLTFLRSIMSETKSNFLFISIFVLRIIYGKLMNLVVNVQLDGNPHVRSAIEQALESGYFGTKGLTFLGTCFFHAVTQKFLKEYLSQLAGISRAVFDHDGFQKAISESSSTDGGMGLVVYHWIKHIAYEVKSIVLCMKSLQDLYKFIEGEKFSEKFTFTYPAPNVYGPKHKFALAKFVREVVGNFPRLCSAYNVFRFRNAYYESY